MIKRTKRTAVKEKIRRYIAFFLAINLLTEICMPTMALALTSGPAQEEYASFEPVETTQLVDPYSGDFSYNLPLLSVPGPNGGYPINLSYHSGIGMEQEASWVGLGWNINAGVINRQLRGLPDDVNGLNVQQDLHMKKYESFTLNIPKKADREFYGIPVGTPSSVSAQVYYNNYKGFGYRVTLTPGKKLTKHLGLFSKVGGTLGLSIDSQNGIGMSVGFSASKTWGGANNLGVGVGVMANYNSRVGFNGFNFSTELKTSEKTLRSRASEAGGGGVSRTVGQNLSFPSSSISFPTSAFVAPVQNPMTVSNTSLGLKLAFGSSGLTVPIPYKVKFKKWLSWTGTYEENKLKFNNLTTRAFGYLYHNNAGDNDLKDYTSNQIAYSKKIPNIGTSSVNYDLFSVNGQGAGGMFRPYSSNVRTYSQAYKASDITNYSYNFEAGIRIGGIVQLHVGFHVPTGNGSMGSGSWKLGIADFPTWIRQHDGPNFSDPLYEDSYFKMYGEKSGQLVNQSNPADEEYPLTTNTNGGQNIGWNGDQALRVKLETTGGGFSNFNEEYKASTKVIPYGGGAEIDISAANFDHNNEQKRQRRASNIEKLTYADALKYGETRLLQYYDASGTLVDKFPSATLPSADYKDLLSEISVRQPDGMKYTYGLPALNKVHKDAHFRVAYGSGSSAINSQSSYPENNVSLIKGWQSGGSINTPSSIGSSPLDEYKSVTSLPKYAHSWLLTSVESNDYVDITSNGPTNDDLGYWVKFNYQQTAGNYKWRVPYTDASYAMGSQSNNLDNSGSYSYGEKEVYFLKSVETKTHIAIFELSQRDDGYEALDELNASDDGTLRGANSMQRIEKIKLYAKADYLAHPTTAVPIKTVNFQYDYTLCPGIPNSKWTPHAGTAITSGGKIINGKLTLKSVWFTYQNSDRGELSPYTFEYASGTYGNPNYNLRDMDRWGNYKPNSDPTFNPENSYPNINFPYTNQEFDATNKQWADQFAEAWHLKKINLPSGGTMNIEYEADDYSYVQDKNAMQMFDIIGCGEMPTFGSQYQPFREQLATLWTNQTELAPLGPLPSSFSFVNAEYYVNPDDGGNYRVYFRLEKALDNTVADAAKYNNFANSSDREQYISDRYIRGVNKIYFDVEADLKKPEYSSGGSSNYKDENFDNVRGYCDIVTSRGGGHDYGVETDGSGKYRVGYITVKKVDLNDPHLFNTKIHPFQKAALQHLRTNREELIYGPPSSTVSIMSLFSPIGDALKMIVSFNRFCYKLHYGSVIKLNGHSVIRLYAPDDKHGGGNRIKQIYIEEKNFQDPTNSSNPSNTTNQYGQVFDYTIDENGTKMSSGVCYEPPVGGEESSLKQPISYTDSHFLRADQNLFLEEPLMESQYPGAGVGYRKITVMSLARANSSGTSCDPTISPTTIYEYYTSKDFPVQFQQTDLSADPKIVRFYFIPGLTTNFRQSMARSQGYSLVLNDMAGKLRKVTTLIPATNIAPEKILSQEEYIYQTKNPYDPNSSSNELNNVVKALKTDGKVTDAVIGETCDIYTDMDENSHVSTAGSGIDWNIGLKIISGIPFILPMIIPLPYQDYYETSFKTVTLNKVIYRTGILKETRTFDGQATLVTKNLAYDIETGNPLLTTVNNEFEDNIYNVQIPAHWYYPGMAPSYQNHDAFFNFNSLGAVTQNTSTTGRYDFPSSVQVASYFNEGDVLWVNFKDGSGTTHETKCYVLDIDAINNSLRLLEDPVYKKLWSGVGSYFSVYCVGVYFNQPTINSIKIIHSGHHNQLLTNAGSLETIIDPFDYSGTNGLHNLSSINGVLNSSVVTFSDNWKAFCACDGYINPFLLGIKGIWRPAYSGAWVDERTQNNNIRKDGTYNSFLLLDWLNPASTLSNPLNKYQISNQITNYSPNGFELENKDAIGVYSAAKYGYCGSMVTLVGKNIKQDDAYFDSFEDYFQGCGACGCQISGLSDGNNPSPTVSGSVTNLEAHTGKNSIVIFPGANVNTTQELVAESRLFTCSASKTYSESSTATGPTSNSCTYMNCFSLNPGTDYIFSAWVKQKPTLTSTTNYTGLNYKNPEFDIRFSDINSVVISSSNYVITTEQTIIGTNPGVTRPKEKIIDGWQRVFVKVTVPSNAISMGVSFSNNNTDVGHYVFVDDIRMHPYKSNIMTYVYDNVTLKTMAELDANNFATYYVYDQEGLLAKVRKETTAGIKTISEGKSAVKQK
ncbi:MAG: hypothetical protein ACXVPN_10320 [Bacteroidia bacterium]